MNIFFLDGQPYKAAQYHCDRHVVKMILESAQLLCTTHRVLDGHQQAIDGRKRWIHPDASMDQVLYTSTHINHPSAIWIRQSTDNYIWLWALMNELNKEFVRRYDKELSHASMIKLEKALSRLPRNLKRGGLTEPPQCMPDQYKHPNFIQAYRNYYMGAKRSFATWTNTPIPDWWN